MRSESIIKPSVVLERTHNIVMVLFLLSAMSAEAHVPFFQRDDSTAERPVKIEGSLTKSLAYYAYFDYYGDVDFYDFEIDQNQEQQTDLEILIGSLVPNCRQLSALRIEWALIGPKQHSLDSNGLPPNQIASLIQPEEGWIHVATKDYGRVWREAYTQHTYRQNDRRKLASLQSGRYRVVVWNSGDLTGDYVLEFGDREEWSWGEVIALLWQWPYLLMESEIQTQDCTTDE